MRNLNEEELALISGGWSANQWNAIIVSEYNANENYEDLKSVYECLMPRLNNDGEITAAEKDVLKSIMRSLLAERERADNA